MIFETFLDRISTKCDILLKWNRDTNIWIMAAISYPKMGSWLKGGGAMFKGGDTVCSSSDNEYGLWTWYKFMN